MFNLFKWYDDRRQAKIVNYYNNPDKVKTLILQLFDREGGGELVENEEWEDNIIKVVYSCVWQNSDRFYTYLVYVKQNGKLVEVFNREKYSKGPANVTKFLFGNWIHYLYLVRHKKVPFNNMYNVIVKGLPQEEKKVEKEESRRILETVE